MYLCIDLDSFLEDLRTEYAEELLQNVDKVKRLTT